MESDNWKHVSFLISSMYRERVLRAVSSPKTPSQIAEEESINITHVSRSLSELSNRKMVKLLTPDSRKGKLFVMTDLGREILELKDSKDQ